MAALFDSEDILYCVQQALTTLNQPRPVSVFSSSDENAVLMGSLANLAGPVMWDACKWQQARTTFTITGDGTATAFPLPAGFVDFVSNTGWSMTNRRPVAILNPQQWASITAWIGQTPFVQPACRLFGDAVNFITAPASAEEITFEYETRNWVVEEDGTTLKSVLENDTDVPRFDKTLFIFALKLAWAQQRGIPTAALQENFNDRWNQIAGRNQMAPTLYIGGSTAASSGRLIDALNVPQTNLGG